MGLSVINTEQNTGNGKPLLILMLCLLLVLSSLHNIIGPLKIFGSFALALTISLPIILYIFKVSIRKKLIKKHLNLYTISGIFFLILIVGILINPSVRGVITFLQILLLFYFMIAVSEIKWTNYRLKMIGVVIATFVVFNFFVWVFTGLPSLFKSIYGSSNLVGIYMLYSVFFIVIAKQYSSKKYIFNFIILLALLVLIGSDTRSAMLAGVISIITYFSWNLISKSKIFFNGFILMVFSFLLTFVFVYPLFPRWKYFNVFESFMLKYTEKSIMSGREDLWLIIIEKISLKPFLGYGTGVQPNDISLIEKSSHNLYLQITMQNGFLGLAAFLLLMFFIWRNFWKVRNIKEIRLISSFFIATLVYQSFEITFTQNFLSIAILQWLLIGIGYSYSLRVNQNEPRVNMNG